MFDRNKYTPFLKETLIQYHHNWWGSMLTNIVTNGHIIINQNKAFPVKHGKVSHMHFEVVWNGALQKRENVCCRSSSPLRSGRPWQPRTASLEVDGCCWLGCCVIARLDFRQCLRPREQYGREARNGGVSGALSEGKFQAMWKTSCLSIRLFYYDIICCTLTWTFPLVLFVSFTLWNETMSLVQCDPKFGDSGCMYSAVVGAHSALPPGTHSPFTYFHLRR